MLCLVQWCEQSDQVIAPVAEDRFQRNAMYFFKKIIVYLEANEHDQVGSSFEEAKAPFK